MTNCGTPSWVMQASYSLGDIRVLKKELEQRYVQFAVLPERLFWKKADSMGYLTIPAKTITSLEAKLQKEIAKKQLLDDCVGRNNQGIAYEKAGDIDAAIKLYEENIKPGCYPAMHSFDRLLVIYKRNGDYKNELRVCKRAVAVFKKIDKYKNRLDKISAKIQKERSKN